MRSVNVSCLGRMYFRLMTVNPITQKTDRCRSCDKVGLNIALSDRKGHYGYSHTGVPIWLLILCCLFALSTISSASKHEWTCSFCMYYSLFPSAGLSFAFLIYFILVWPWRPADWVVCSAENIAKKLWLSSFFYRKIWIMFFSLNLQWVVHFRLSINATQMYKTSALTISSWEMHFLNLSKWFRIIFFFKKRTIIFATFSHSFTS